MAVTETGSTTPQSGCPRKGLENKYFAQSSDKFPAFILHFDMDGLISSWEA